MKKLTTLNTNGHTHKEIQEKHDLFRQRTRKESNLARQKSFDKHLKKTGALSHQGQQKWNGEPIIPPLLDCNEVPQLSSSHFPKGMVSVKAEWGVRTAW